jgi:hypothetical protein
LTYIPIALIPKKHHATFINRKPIKKPKKFVTPVVSINGK